jgi:gliding motility-associated-like protein
VMGADLEFQCIGPNQYRVILTGYRDCQGIDMSGPQTVSVSSATCGVTTSLTLQQVGPPVDITPVCLSLGSSCHGGSGIGIEKYTFEGILNLPAGCGADWVISWQLCCRNAAITTLSNPSSEDLYIETRLNNTLASCDNSPTFTNDPIGVYCNGYPQFFNHGAVDADGDSLYFYLTNSLNGPGSSVAYGPGRSGASPMAAAPPVVINSATGQLSFTPSQTQIAVMKVGCDEFRNGVLIGHIERDMQVIITNCNNSPPTSGGVNGTTGANQYVYNTTACSNFCFTIQTADANAADSVRATFLAASLPGATISSSGGLKPLLTICWAPTQADVGSHPFVIAVRDNACPYNGTGSQGYTINVAAASNPPVSAGRDTTLCPGASVTLNATTTGSVTSYVWSDGSTTHTGQTWSVNPAVTTIYTVTANYTNGCQLTDQVVVTRDVPPTVTAFPANSTICSNSDTIQLSAFASGTVTYSWTPPGGLTCTTCPNPKASPTATTVYSVRAIDAAGCPSAPFNVTVNLSPPPPPQSCAVIYATVNGSGNGTQASPASLATALSMAQCNNSVIRMGIGTYNIDNPITNISSYTTLEGGFDPGNNWVKSSTLGATTIHRSALNMEGTVFDKRIVAIYFNGNNYFRLQDLTIETADCPALAAGDNSGYSNYVIHMTNAGHYDIVRCQLKPGKPTDGRAGSTTPGTGGAATGGTAGAGGAGAGTGCNQNGTAGSAGGAASSGAAGGAGGARGAGSGCNTIGCGVNASSGSNGTAGISGVAGTNASPIAPATPGVTTSLFLVAGQSASGTNGTAGGGGGGGGGGQMGTDCTCGISGSNSGTAGSAGGNGGLGGGGGYGGGGTFGIYMNGNGVGCNIIDCDIIQNIAGVGGAAGVGQAGTNSSAPTAGPTTSGSCSPQSRGGTGGQGGNGGAGGNGQPGANGVTAEIVLNGTAPTYTTHGAATALVTGINNPPIFNLGAQTVISADNISCTNRNDVLSSGTSSNWTTGSGATVPSGSGTSITTQYTTIGRKDIGFNSSTYTGFVYIAIDQNSFIPTIQSSAPVLHTDTFWVCKGSSANFTLQIASADSFQWNFGGATVPNTYYGGSSVQNLNGLTFNTAGTFLVQGRILTSCCGWSPWDTAYILVEPVSTISYTGPTSFCAGDSVHIILSGIGSSYSWAPPQGVSNPTGSNVYIAPQVTTTYLATAYSPRGLCNADTSITITKILPPTLTFTTVPASCGPTGSAMVTPAPTGTYSYLWNNTTGPTTGATISNQPSGTYTVTVTPQGTTCSVSAATSIGTAGGVQAFIVKTVQPKCFGQCNGQVKVKAIGGVGPFVYHWSPGPTGALDSLINICAGTYSVTITDANNCSSSTSVALTSPALLTVVMLDSVSPRCPGQCTGYAFADGQGGTGPYSFAWSNGSLAQKDTLLCAGRYTLAIVDRNGCTATGAVNISTPPSLSLTYTSINDSCFGDNKGSITLSVTGGTPQYTYAWPQLPANNTSSAINLPANTYTAYATDSFGCKDTIVATITQPTMLTATIARTDSVSCFGLNDGRVVIAAGGGTSPYTYQLDGAGAFQPADSFLSLAPGAHSVLVVDAHNCAKTVNFNIYQPTLLTAVTLNKRNASCFGICDGMIRIRPTGGTPSYSYSINGLSFSPVDSFSALCAGNLTITVQDHRGCSVTVIDSITQPTPVVLSLVSSQDPSCYGSADGQIVVSASGGSPLYLYGIDVPTPQPTGTFNNVLAGLHILGVSDSHGCLDTLHILLGQPSQILADTVSTKSVTCNGGNDGQIVLQVSGGTGPYTYAWPTVSPVNSDSIADNLTANTYSAYVTDSRGCKDTVTAAITQPALLTGTALVDSISCFGLCDGKVFITSAGGTAPYQFQLDASGVYQQPDSFTALCLGAHTITIQDANLCTTTVNFTVDQPAQLFASIAATRDVTCSNLCDGMVRASGTGGTLPYSYSIDGFTYFLIDSFNSVCPGSYTMTILDLHGCSATAPFTINQPTPVVLGPVDSTAPRCYNGNDGQYTVVASGGTPGSGYQYSGDGGVTYQTNPHFTGQTPGTHLVTVKDGNGCTTTYTITVLNAPPNDSYSTVITPVTCNGGSDGSITASINGGGTLPPYTYAWSYNGVPNGQTTPALTGIPAGTYVPYILDGNGCQVFGPADSVVPQPTPITDTYVVTPTKCNGSSDGIISVTPSGGTPPYTHSWSNGDNTANPNNFAVGPYTDTIRDANGCVHIDNTIIMTQPTPVTEILTPTPISCPGDSDGTITVVASGGTPGYTYNWSPISSSSATVSGLKAGSYDVIVTDANSCTSTASAVVAPANPMVLNPQKKNVLCPPLKNGFIYLPISGGVPAYNYSWSNGSVSDYLPGLAEGTYNVTVTDANGCHIDTSFVVSNDSSFVIRVTPDTATIPQGDQVLFAIDVTGGTLATISWDPAVNLTCADCTTPVGTPMHTVQYTIHGVSDSGCVSDTRSLITVIPQHQLFVPNVFTPNGDGINDTWEIYGNKKSWLFVEVNVFDRWGEKVFESNDINFAWDGKFKGTLMEPNVYVYVLKVTFVDDYTASNKGTVTIVR